MPFACKICLLNKGLSGADIHTLPRSEEELFEHLEQDHHMPVARDGETRDEAVARFLKKFPEAVTCEDCIRRGAPWTK